MSDVPHGPDWWQDGSGNWHPSSAFSSADTSPSVAPAADTLPVAYQPPTYSSPPSYPATAYPATAYPARGYPSAGYVPGPTNIYFSAGPRTSGTAVFALVLAILSWILLPFVGAVAGFALGISARREIRRSNGAIAGDGMALAAIVLSGIHLALAVLGIILLLILVIGAAVSVSL